jgi:hypothetical protein
MVPPLSLYGVRIIFAIIIRIINPSRSIYIIRTNHYLDNCMLPVCINLDSWRVANMAMLRPPDPPLF